MIFKINGLQFGGNSKLKVESPVAGLGTADIRTSQGNFSGRDGGYVSAQFYGPRQVVINGFYHAGTCDEADDLRASISRTLKIREALRVYITSFSNRSYLLDCYLLDIKMDVVAPTHGKFQLTLIAPDPYLYDAGNLTDPETGFLQQLFYKPIPGGYTMPYSLPVTWETGAASTPIVNAGSVAVLPEIVLEHKHTNPIITNLTTGKYMQLMMTTTQGDRIVIDMRNREITLNNSSVAANRTLTSDWWDLETGTNMIVLGSDSSTDRGLGTIRWRQAFEGV